MGGIHSYIVVALMAAGAFSCTTVGRGEEDVRPVSPPARKAGTHEELEPLAVEFKRLASLRLDGQGRLLACDAGAKQIKVINAAGELIDTIDLEFAPEAIDVAADGTVEGVVCHGWNGILLLEADPSLVVALAREAVCRSRRAVAGLIGPADQTKEARRRLGLDRATTTGARYPGARANGDPAARLRTACRGPRGANLRRLRAALGRR